MLILKNFKKVNGSLVETSSLKDQIPNFLPTKRFQYFMKKFIAWFELEEQENKQHPVPLSNEAHLRLVAMHPLRDVNQYQTDGDRKTIDRLCLESINQALDIYLD